MSIGLLCGVMYSYLGSTQRFMGLEENSYEVKKFGVMTSEELLAFNERAWRGGAIDLIDSKK